MACFECSPLSHNDQITLDDCVYVDFFTPQGNSFQVCTLKTQIRKDAPGELRLRFTCKMLKLSE